ncbi:AfsR/SARP family transcriptional regulator [Nonomuraea jiangxiensis]|uniref:DNA-binding transcriptional activator of the SARP family n=1 Tax=Nonomuraea jiangxiensis TaxID=633440 RepID=A0A1G8ME02_9ACTN|nr:AfsR/SARP family transcriptional regulator [Nonomuraea jiangxiensis]SDI66161.1 DNA-binding transcriptional activator of the SARP family [Nonomuraea jiangxiensis]
MQFGILGALEVMDGEHQLSPRSIKQRSLLALLLCHHGMVAQSELLIDALWGAEAGDAGGQRLRLQLHRLRRTLGESVPISHRPTGYQLRVPDDAVDAWRFESLVREGRQALLAKNVARGSDLLRTALDMWRGPALSGLNDISFLHRQATRLEEQRLAALADRINADLRLRRHSELVGELSALVREHPLRERFRGQLMIALYRSGRQAEALDVYRDGRHILTKDLGLEPSMELRRLQVAILTSDSSLSDGRVPVGGRAVHRRGGHRHVQGCPHCSKRLR